MSQTAYQKLETAFAQISALRGASAMLGWDCAVMMPDGASAIRGEQLAALAEVAHEKITDARLDDLLNAAEADAANLTDWQQANVREMRHQYVHENAVPADLVSAFTKQSNDTEMFWRTARAENNFRDFCPKLKSLIALVRETAQVKRSSSFLPQIDQNPTCFCEFMYRLA